MGRPQKGNRQYTQEAVNAAVEAVRRGVPMRTAAAMHGVPKSTLSDKVNARTPLEMVVGPRPVLPEEVEQRVYEWIVRMSAVGYGQTKQDVLNKVAELVTKLEIKTKWENGRPSEKWYRLFMKRHSDLTLRNTMALSRSRASVSFDNILSWFRELEGFLVTTGNFDILEDPTRIYNCDETGFPFSPKTAKVLTKKDQRNVYQAGIGGNKTQITVLVTVSASGHYIDPLIVYPGVQPRVQLREDFHKVFPGAMFGNSNNGWMDSELFRVWIEKGFDDGLKRRKVRKPVLLIIDGAKQHISIETSEYCNENNILLYVLFPNATHLIQPLDIVFMNVVKKIYKEEVRKWCQQHPGEAFDKYRFAEVMVIVWSKVAKSTYGITGFEEAGIFPFNPMKVKKGKMAPATLYGEPEEPLPEMDASVLEETQEVVLQVPENAPEDIAATPEDPPEDIAATPEDPPEDIAATPEDPPEENAATPKRVEEKKIVIVYKGKRFGLLEEKKQETIDDILALPQPKRSKIGGARMQGLPRCVSSDEWLVVKRKKEAEKKKEEEEKEQRRLEREEKKQRIAEEKEKKQREKQERLRAKEEAAAWQVLARKRQRRKSPTPVSSSSEEEEDIPYAETSEAESEEFYEGSTSRCAKCDKAFNTLNRNQAIGCEMEYCRRWYHPRCTGLDLKGKTPKQIREMPFICTFC